MIQETLSQRNEKVINMRKILLFKCYQDQWHFIVHTHNISTTTDRGRGLVHLSSQYSLQHFIVAQPSSENSHNQSTIRLTLERLTFDCGTSKQ